MAEKNKYLTSRLWRGSPLAADRMASLLFYLSILFFIIGFNFSDNRAGGWTQQFMPYPTGGQIRDICFVDSLLGFAVSDSSILKTTNSGENWTVKYNSYYIFRRIQFLNFNTGFACGGNNKLLKTTNSGDNWTIMTPSTIYPYDMSVLNEDTIWLVDANTLVGGVYRTTNGGGSWDRQFTTGTSHIYMYNARIGFIDGGGLKKTTDGGFSWTPIPGEGLFSDMHFVDSLTGWKCLQSIKKTTDGGLTWVNQTLPTGGMIIISQVREFSNINRDTIWAAGGWVQYPNFQSRAILYRTTNGGNNWLFQVPDTNIHIFEYYHIKFVNNQIGWAYSPSTGIHTTTGGNDTFYTGIQQVSSQLPSQFKLYQNYPNPFNPRTIISYELRVTSYVALSVYDIQGKHIVDLVDQKQNAGKYQVDFSGIGLSSGIYFYKIIIIAGKEVFTDTKKMILLK